MIITYNPKYVFQVLSRIFHISQIFHKTVKHYKTAKHPKTSKQEHQIVVPNKCSDISYRVNNNSTMYLSAYVYSSNIIGFSQKLLHQNYGNKHYACIAS